MDSTDKVSKKSCFTASCISALRGFRAHFVRAVHFAIAVVSLMLLIVLIMPALFALGIGVFVVAALLLVGIFGYKYAVEWIYHLARESPPP